MGGAGCAGGSAGGGSREASLTALKDTSGSINEQMRAVRAVWQKAEDGELTHAAARESLKDVAWKRSRWWEVRVAAIEELLKDEANETDTRHMLRLMLPTETIWQVITYICDAAAEGGWTELTPALVRSWSRPVVEPGDDARPERFALERLHPERRAEEIVFGVFAGEWSQAEQLRERDRRDAWSLLRRLDPQGERTIEMLRGLPEASAAGDAWVTAIFASARDLGSIPDTGEQLEWVAQLRADAPYWERASSAIARLDAEQRRGLAIRHAAPILWAMEHRPSWVGMSRAELRSLAESELKRRRKFSRSSDRIGGEPRPELLSAWRDQMSWGDLLTTLVAKEVVTSPDVAAALFEQVAVDRKDTSTEHGGLLLPAKEGVVVEPHTPRPAQRMGDQRFTAPPEMFERGAQALFHYHFHAQRANNRNYAGPSAEDIAYAQRHGRSCIVFTSIDEDTLNVDYYQPDGAVIDVGVVKRPGR